MSTKAEIVPHRRVSPAVASVGVLLCVIACAVIVTARQFPATAIETDIGAGAFPRFYAGLLVALAAALVASNYLTSGITPHAHEPLRYGRVAAGVGITAGYIVLLSFAGYLISTPLFLIALMGVMNRQRLWLKPAIALVITFALWLLFSVALQVPLPVGSLFE
ncbi:tripartite tricarboxylate transporter TctB family protein [Pseudocitrobacter cyperus]|uniref:Tripartite tricarboxylate transporter TctB family protein n=1 Tax=Pseudocitrobacter cyperus TaxID=3112843 RepID=A0ABV0HQK3_9ENTR